MKAKIKKAKKVEKAITTVTARFDEKLYSRMQVWLKENGLSANQLLAKAVDNYISNDQMLKAVPITKEKLAASIDRVFKNNGSTLDKLK